MKTQINTLRSGSKDQLLNKNVDYSILPKASSHNGHCGTNSKIVSAVWEKVIQENKEFMSVNILGFDFKLTANWSISGKSVSYVCTVPDHVLLSFGLEPSKRFNGYLNICCGNHVVISNGYNSYSILCPSLVLIK